ncbi:7-cyano-7-deazaguanine synthase, partial [bacterium]|nr:7-cyano-7-deazaguanine synthase [bacterium]
MKAIALLSGGLDSTLAIKIILEQGIEVEAVNFFTPFCQCNRKESGCGHEAKKVTDRFGIKLKMFNISTEYLKMLKSPKYGYGRNLNPCIDCRILMNKKTKEYMGKIGASFVIT